MTADAYHFNSALLVCLFVCGSDQMLLMPNNTGGSASQQGPSRGQQHHHHLDHLVHNERYLLPPFVAQHQPLRPPLNVCHLKIHMFIFPDVGGNHNTTTCNVSVFTDELKHHALLFTYNSRNVFNSASSYYIYNKTTRLFMVLNK